MMYVKWSSAFYYDILYINIIMKARVPSMNALALRVESGTVVRERTLSSDKVCIYVQAYQEKIYTCVLHLDSEYKEHIPPSLVHERVLVVTNLPVISYGDEVFDAILLFAKTCDTSIVPPVELIKPQSDRHCLYTADGSCESIMDISDTTRLSRDDGLYEIRALHIHNYELYYKQQRLLDVDGRPAHTTRITQVSIY